MVFRREERLTARDSVISFISNGESIRLHITLDAATGFRVIFDIDDTSILKAMRDHIDDHLSRVAPS